MAWSEHFQTPAWLVVSALLDVISLINVAVLCHTDMLDNYGRPVTDISVLRKHFLFKRRGLLVLLVSLPVELFVFAASDLHIQLSTGRELDTVYDLGFCVCLMLIR